ncbi:MAG TPA: T9SS type A sorting domain-containing protein, partial [Bacteroidia bacterium]
TLIVVKMSTSGQVQWSESLVVATSDTGAVGACTIMESPAGGYHLLLSNYRSGATVYDLIHLDYSGNLVWNKSYSVGNAPVYNAPQMHAEANGNVLLVFSVYDRISLMRVDANGNTVWSGAYTSDPNEPKNPGFDAAPCSDGGILASGKANADIFLVKLDATGQVQWTKRFGNNSYDHPNCVIKTNDGNNIIGGYDIDYNSFITNAYLLKIDNSGNVIWYKKYANIQSFDRLLQMANGYMVGLGTNMIVVMDQNGNPISCKVADAYPDYLYLMNIARTYSDDLLALGAGYDSSFAGTNVLFGSSWMSMLWCNVSDSLVSVSGTVFSPVVTSNTFSMMPAPINISAAVYSSSSFTTGSANFCVGTQVDEQGENTAASIYPDPVNSFATIDMGSVNTSNAVFVLYDILGNEVKRMMITGQQTRLERGDLPAGIYMYRILMPGSSSMGGKLIIAD